MTASNILICICSTAIGVAAVPTYHKVTRHRSPPAKVQTVKRSHAPAASTPVPAREAPVPCAPALFVGPAIFLPLPGFDAPPALSLGQPPAPGPGGYGVSVDDGAVWGGPGIMPPPVPPAVPEPGAWALMVVGFGAVGVTMRRQPAKV